MRRAFIEGADEHSRRLQRRPLTTDELRRILLSYPGD
jgi:hypothetical protein